MRWVVVSASVIALMIAVLYLALKTVELERAIEREAKPRVRLLAASVR